jgi:hypothetical protein
MNMSRKFIVGCMALWFAFGGIVGFLLNEDGPTAAALVTPSPPSILLPTDMPESVMGLELEQTIAFAEGECEIVGTATSGSVLTDSYGYALNFMHGMPLVGNQVFFFQGNQNHFAAFGVYLDNQGNIWWNIITPGVWYMPDDFLRGIYQGCN